MLRRRTARRRARRRARRAVLGARGRCRCGARRGLVEVAEADVGRSSTSRPAAGAAPVSGHPRAVRRGGAQRAARPGAGLPAGRRRGRARARRRPAARAARHARRLGPPAGAAAAPGARRGRRGAAHRAGRAGRLRRLRPRTTPTCAPRCCTRCCCAGAGCRCCSRSSGSRWRPGWASPAYADGAARPRRRRRRRPGRRARRWSTRSPAGGVLSPGELRARVGRPARARRPAPRAAGGAAAAAADQRPRAVDPPDRLLESVRTRLWAVELSLLLPRHPLALRRERGELLVRLGDAVAGAAELEAYADVWRGGGRDGAVRRSARLARAQLN